MEGRGRQDADGVRRSRTFSGRQVPLEMGKVRVGGSGRPVSAVLSAAASRRASVNSSQETAAELSSALSPRVTLEPHPRSPFRRKEEPSKTVLQVAQVSSGPRFQVKKATGPHLNARSPLKTIQSTTNTGKNDFALMRSSRDDAKGASGSGEILAKEQTEKMLQLREQVALNTDENAKTSAEELSTGNRPNTSAVDLLLTEEQPEGSTNVLEEKAIQSNSENTRSPELPRRSSLVLPAATGTFVSSMPSLTKVRSSFTARELALFTQRLETSESEGHVQRYHVASHPHSTAATIHSLTHRSNQDHARTEERRSSHKRTLPSSKPQRESNNLPSERDKVESTWKRVDTSIEHIYEDPSIDMVQQYLLHSHHTTSGQKKRKMVERERALAAASDLREHQSEEQKRQEKRQQRKLQLQKMSEAIRLQNQRSVRAKAVHSSDLNERRTRSTRRAESAPTLPERKPPVPRLSRPVTSANTRQKKPKMETSRPQGGVSTSILMGLTPNPSDTQQENAVKDEVVDEEVAGSPGDHVAAKRKPASNTPRSSKRKKRGVTAEPSEAKAAVQAREERRAIAREYMLLQKQSRKVWSAKAKEQSQREQEKRQQKLELLEATRLKKLRLSRKRSKEQKKYELDDLMDEPPATVAVAIPSTHGSMIQGIEIHGPTKLELQPEGNRSDDKELTLDEPDVDIENDGGIGNIHPSELSTHHENRAESFYGNDQDVNQNVETDDRFRKLLELREKAAALSARLSGLRNQTRGSDAMWIPSANLIKPGDDEFQARAKDTGKSEQLEGAEDSSQDESEQDEELSEQADDSEGSERGNEQSSSGESSSSDSDTSKPTKQLERNTLKEEIEMIRATEAQRGVQQTEVDAADSFGVYEVDGNDEDIDIRSIGVHNIGVVWPIEQQNDTTVTGQAERSPLDRSPSSSSSVSPAPASPTSSQRENWLDNEENVVNEEGFELEFYQQMKSRLKSPTPIDEATEAAAARGRESEDGVDSASSSDSEGHLAPPRRFNPADRGYKQKREPTGKSGDSSAGLMRLIRETDDSLSVVDRAAKRLFRQQLERSERKREMELQERMEAEKRELLAKDLALKTVMASITGKESSCSDSDDMQSNAEENELQSSQYKRLEEIMDEVEKERARENEATSESDRDTSIRDETEQKPSSAQSQNVNPSQGLPVSPSSAFWDQLVAETTEKEAEDPDVVAQRESRLREDQTSTNSPRLNSPRTLSRKLLAAVNYQETIFEAHMELAMMEHSHRLASVRAETITLAQVFKEEMENNSTAQLEKKVDGYMNDVMQQLDAIRQVEEQVPYQQADAPSSAALGVDTSVAAGEHDGGEQRSILAIEASYELEYASDDDFYEESFEKESQRKSEQQLPTSDASIREESRSKSLRKSESESEIQSEQEDDFYEESFERDSQLHTEQQLPTSDASIVEESRSKSLAKSEIESEIRSAVSKQDCEKDFGVSGEKSTVEEESYAEDSAMEAAVESEVEDEVPSSPIVESNADESMSVNYEEDFEACSPKAQVVPNHLSQGTVEDELETSKMSEDSVVESEVEDEVPSSATVASKVNESMSVNYEEDFEVSSPKPRAMSNRLSQDMVEDEFQASKSSEASAAESTMENEVPSSPTVESKADASMSMNYEEDFEASSPKARATSNQLNQDTVEDELEVSKSSEESESSGDIEEEVGENDSAKAEEESATEHVESDYYSSQFDDANAFKSTKKLEQFTVQTQDQPKRDKAPTSVPNELKLSGIQPSSTVSAAYVVDLERRKQAEESLLSLRLQTVEQKYQRELKQLENTLGSAQDLETRKETLLMAFMAEKANVESLKAASTARYYQDLHTFRSLCLDWPHTVGNESNRGQPPYFSGQVASFVPAVVSPVVVTVPSKPPTLEDDEQDTSTRHEYTDDFGSENDDTEAIEEERNDKSDAIAESTSIGSEHSRNDDNFKESSDVPEEEEEDFEQESDGKAASVQEDQEDFVGESDIKSASVQEEGEEFEPERDIKSPSVQEEEDFERESDRKSASEHEEEVEYEDEFVSMSEDVSERKDVVDEAEVAENSEIDEHEAHSDKGDSDYDEDFASISESTPIQRASSANSSPPDETEVGVMEEKPSDAGEISSGSDIEVQQKSPTFEEVDSEEIAKSNQQKYSEDDFESGQLDQSVLPPAEQSMSHRMGQSSSEDSSMTKLLVAEVAILQKATGAMKKSETEDDKLATKKAKVEELLRAKERLLNQQTETFRRDEEKRQVDVLAKLALEVDVEEKLRRAKDEISQQLTTEFDTLKQTYPMLRVTASTVPKERTETASTPSVISKLFGKNAIDRATVVEEGYEEEYEAESFEEELNDRDGNEAGLTKQLSDVASYEADEVEAEDSNDDVVSEVPSHESDVAEAVVTSIVGAEEVENDEQEASQVPSESDDYDYENESFDEAQSVPDSLPDGDEEASEVKEDVSAAEELPVEYTRKEEETLEQSGYDDEEAYSDEAFDSASELSTNEAEEPVRTPQVATTNESITIDAPRAAEKSITSDEELAEAIETDETQLEEKQAANSAEFESDLAPKSVLNESNVLAVSVSVSLSRDEVEESLTKSIEERNARLQALKQKVENRKKAILAVQKQMRVERRKEKLVAEEKLIWDEMEAVERLLHADEAALDLCQQRNRLEMMHLEARHRKLSAGRKPKQNVREQEIDLLREFDYIEEAQTDGKQQRHSAPASRGHTSRRFDLLDGYSYIEAAEPVAFVPVIDTPEVIAQRAEAGKSDGEDYGFSAQDALVKEDGSQPLTSSEHFDCGEESLTLSAGGMKSDIHEVDEEFQGEKHDRSNLMIEREYGTQHTSKLETTDEAIVQHGSLGVEGPVDLLAEYAFVEIAEVVSCVKSGLPSADLLVDYDYVEIVEAVPQEHVLQPEAVTDATAYDHDEVISPPGSEVGYGVYETVPKAESEREGDFVVVSSTTHEVKSSVKLGDDNDTSNNAGSVEESIEDEESNVLASVAAGTGMNSDSGPREEAQQTDVTRHEAVVDRISTLLYADIFQEMEEEILSLISSGRLVQLQPDPQLPTMQGSLPESPQPTPFSDEVGEGSIDSRYTADWSVEQSSESVRARSPKTGLPSSENVCEEEEELASIEESATYADSFAEESFLHSKEGPDVLKDSSDEKREEESVKNSEQGGGSIVEFDKQKTLQIPSNSELEEAPTETKTGPGEALQSEQVADAIFGAVFDEIITSELQLWSRQPSPAPQHDTSESTTKHSDKRVVTVTATSTSGSPMRTPTQKSRARDRVLTRRIVDQLDIVDGEIRLPTFKAFNVESDFPAAQALYDTVEDLAYDYFRAIQQSLSRIDSTSVLALLHRNVHAEIDELLAVRAQSEHELERQLQLISDESGVETGLNRDVLLSQNCIVSNVKSIVSKVQSDLSRTTEELSTAALLTEPSLLPRTPSRRAKSTSILSSLQTQQDQELQQRITGMILSDLMRDAGLP
ncbi:hypothetical protein V7S43_003397 [Phytophthora oleae]|uniref:Uncharacterized protein n=1 Tax=Phytophthora oleae TaxID=2107226 RepID=A0ABD3FZ42_9STRA